MSSKPINHPKESFLAQEKSYNSRKENEKADHEDDDGPLVLPGRPDEECSKDESSENSEIEEYFVLHGREEAIQKSGGDDDDESRRHDENGKDPDR